MKKYTVTLVLLLFFMINYGFAQIPSGYYDGTEGLSGVALKLKLHTIIEDHTELENDNGGIEYITKLRVR